MSLSKSKSIVNVNDLPEDVLHMIMLFVPLQVRITKRVICQKWKQIIEDTFKRVRSLKLFDSFQILTAHYCPLLLARGLDGDQDLALSNLNDDLVLGGTLAYEYEDFTRVILTEGGYLSNVPSGGHFLVNLFPNVEKLVVATLHNSDRINFEHLLAHFAPQLTTLAFVMVNITGKLIENFMTSPTYYNIGHVIGSLSNLRALHLHDTNFGTNRQILAQSSPILANLETLSLTMIDARLLEFNFLTRPLSLKHLTIDCVSSLSHNLFDLLAQENAQLAKQLESLSIGCFFSRQFLLTTLVDSICTHYGAILELNLNLSDRQYVQIDDERKTLAFLITQLGKLKKLVNLSFKIESEYFDITREELATIPVMRNIVHLKVELLNIKNLVEIRLERCLLTIFPNATQILLRTPYRESMYWQVGRDRLMEMVERNAPIMRMDGTEELEVDVAPLLGRHEDKYRRECLGEGQFGPFVVDEEEEEDSEDDEEEEEEEQNFLGISIELLTLLYEEETLDYENPFLTGSQLQKMEAFKRILSSHTPSLDCSTNYETMMTALNKTFTETATQQIAILALECIRLIATESKSGRFPLDAKPWISMLLYHFGNEHVIGRIVDSLNAALDAIWRATPFDMMVKQIELPLVHPDPSVRKATALFIYRVLSQVEPERIIINGDDANQNNDALRSVGALLAKDDESEEVRVALRMALIEWDKVKELRR